MGEVIDIRSVRLQSPAVVAEPVTIIQSINEQIKWTARAIVNTGLLHELFMEDGRTPHPMITKTMFRDINRGLDMLSDGEQERAWQQASGIIDI